MVVVLGGGEGGSDNIIRAYLKKMLQTDLTLEWVTVSIEGGMFPVI